MPQPEFTRPDPTPIADTLLEIYLRFAELGRQELARRKAIGGPLETPDDVQAQEHPRLQSKR